MTDPAKCSGKHTKYQPTDKEWKCPRCGTAARQPDEFWGGERCPRLHEDDVVACTGCKHTASGRSFAARLQKAASMVPCPTCKGYGLVKGAEKAGA